MSKLEKTGEKIINTIKKTEKKGISVTDLHKRLGGTCDCETWVNTLIQSKVIEVIGKTDSGARIVRYKE